MRRVRIFLVGMLCSVAGAAAASTPEATPKLPQHAYVWQRSWTPTIRQGVAENGPAFGGLDILVAEVTPRATPAGTVVVQPDWAALRATGRPIGVVVRVGPLNGSTANDGAATRAITRACIDALARARAAGIEPAELQIDFDAATNRLADYRAWLQVLRREVHPPRLVITALPDWLRSAEFPALAREAGAYVLQVHSLEKPTGVEEPVSLCDPDRAEAWISAASTLGIPFRVALPAYGYRVAFGRDGRFLGLQAEGPVRAWPAGSTVRTALADPAPLARLVRRLLAAPPPACEGLVWFRLPGANDELAWRWPTLAAVMKGEEPQGRLELSPAPTGDGTSDLVLLNPGNAQTNLSGFRLRWQDATLVAADAIGGWRLERTGPGELTVQPPSEARDDLLFPGDRRKVGWLRLSHDVAVTATPLR